MTTDRADVLIVGYGPVGQALAALLGQRGHRVIVCERHPDLYPTPRAGHFDHEIMRIFQAMGVSDQVAEIAAPARVYEFLDADGAVVARLPRDWPAPSGWDASYHFYQPELEKILDGRVRELPSVEVRRGVTVTGISQSPSGVLVHTDRGDLDARFVVGADGANSTVRSSIGLAMDDLGFSAEWLVVDVRVRDGRAMPDIPDTGQVCNPLRPSHMARLGGRYLRWEFMLVPGDNPRELNQQDTIWALLRPWVAPEDAQLIRHVIYEFRSMVSPRFRVGRVLLAGDAAHLMPPFLGQGMCSGIRDTAMLAWQLDLVLRRVAHDQLLDDYAAARRPHVMSYIQESMRVGAVVCETDPERAASNLRAMSAAAAVPPPFQPSLGGGDRELDRLAGTLSVQPRQRREDGVVERLDSHLQPGFQLLTVRPLDPKVSDLVHNLSASIGLQHVEVGGSEPVGAADSDELFRSWAKTAGVTAVVVRPDFYVFGSTAADGLSSLLNSLPAALHLA